MLTEMVRQLTVDNQEISSLAERFAAEMKRGLAGDRSSLKMLPSYIDRPAPGQKLTGEFVAVDFGGTNVRILLVGLSGPGEVEIVAKKIFPLRDEGGKDYTCLLYTS
ncbi:MAG: hexokinase, partial [Negativicutes bacterium]|nr:hexokinase [Negativicutes bacterium]